MVEQLHFMGIPVKDSEARLSGKFWFNEGDEIPMHEDVYYVVKGRCDVVTTDAKSYDKIGGVRQVFQVEASDVVRLDESKAGEFFGPPVQLVDHWGANG